MTYKGKRRAGEPMEIPGVAPASSYSESPQEAQRRQRDVATPRTLQNAKRTYFWRRFAVVAIVVAVLLLGGTAFAVYQYAAGVNSEMNAQFSKIGGGKLAGSLDAAAQADRAVLHAPPGRGHASRREGGALRHAHPRPRRPA